jgi:hypothetical protein
MANVQVRAVNRRLNCFTARPARTSKGYAWQVDGFGFREIIPIQVSRAGDRREYIVDSKYNDSVI